MYDWEKILEEYERNKFTPFSNMFSLPTFYLEEDITENEYILIINEITRQYEKLQRLSSNPSSSKGDNAFPTSSFKS